MKLNFGCGTNKIDRFVNIDKYEELEPDLTVDLEKFPLPFEDEVVEQITMLHFLEHICPNVEDYKKFWQEIYRICKNNAQIFIEVPYYDHWTHKADPTHVRNIHPMGLQMMDQERNMNDPFQTETKLGLLWGVNFKLTEVILGYDVTFEPLSYRCTLEKLELN